MSVAREREDAMRAALAAEPDWQVLLRHFDFNEGFAFVLILVEGAENGALCREALGDYLKERDRGTIRLIAPSGPDAVRDLPYQLHRPKVPDTVQALWIESVVPEGSVSPEEFEEWRTAWRVCFSSLNRIRNTMQRTIPCALVFVAAPWMQELIRNVAPDFWSIRSTVVRISPRVPRQELEGLSEPIFRRPESDPALAPDPDFAEREADKLRGKPGQELALARILQRAGEGFLARAEPKQAVRVLEEAQKLHVGAAASPADLAYTKTSLGRAFQMDAQWPQAEVCFRDALELDHLALGEDHPTTATDMGDLASLLYATNRLEEAEPLFRNVLAIYEKSYGPDHPQVAAALNNLAELLRATNRLAEAEPLYRRALAIHEKSYGPNHPLLATALNNLASLLEATRRLLEAEPLYRRALAIDEKSYEPDYPEAAVRVSNLAGLLTSTNRLAEAEPLYRRALAIHEKSYGPNHPYVATALNNLAMFFVTANRFEEAEPLYRRALAIDEKSYGPDHPEVATDLNNLAGLLRVSNRLEEAEPHLLRALAILEAFTAKTGYPHPSLDAARRNYQQCLDELGYRRGKGRKKRRHL
jgi:tetratricopeptide (TPR) repeat protein